MKQRPNLDAQQKSSEFLDFYYLKEELVAFCRSVGLPASGGKTELRDRIARFLDTGELARSTGAVKRKKTSGEISIDAKIEPDIVCSERHRAFFKQEIGRGFSFNVAFQKWLKSNAGKTYGEAVEAYRDILKNKKNSKTEIDSQFEYNTYIRDFFADNKGRSLSEAIACWKYKKSLPGHSRYEKADLTCLE